MQPDYASKALAIYQAIKLGDIAMLKKSLDFTYNKENFILDITENKPESLLFRAIVYMKDHYAESLEVLKYLLVLFSNFSNFPKIINEMSCRGQTVLHIAIIERLPDVAILLLNLGADYTINPSPEFGSHVNTIELAKIFFTAEQFEKFEEAIQILQKTKNKDQNIIESKLKYGKKNISLAEGLRHRKISVEEKQSEEHEKSTEGHDQQSSLPGLSFYSIFKSIKNIFSSQDDSKLKDEEQKPLITK